MLYIINELFDTIRFFLLMYILFAGKMQMKRNQITIIGIGYFVVFSVMIFLDQEYNLYLLGTLTQIIGVIFFLNERIYEKILSFLLLFSLPTVTELSVEILVRYFLRRHLLENFMEDNYVTIGRIIVFIIITGIVLIFRGRLQRAFVSNASKFLLSVITILFMITLAWITSGEHRIDKITSLLMSICCIVIILIIIWILVIDSSRKMQAVNTEKAKQYLRYLEQLEKNQKEVRSIYHDLRRHLKTLNYYASENSVDKILKYLENLEVDISEHYENVFYTKNRLFNAILLDKNQLAEQNGINLEFKGNLGEKLNVDDYDLTIILSNLLDNALEYVIHNGFDKIKVFIHQESDSIVLTISNPIKKEEDVQIGTTSKDNGDIHGYGLLNVKRAVEKYNGRMNLSIENGWFTTKILIMN